MIPFHAIRPASRLAGPGLLPPRDAWRLASLAGTLTELSASGASATRTLAMRLVWEAQRDGEPAAWVTGAERCFYPPDAAANGVDLRALAVVRVPEASGIARAADTLIRSGAFGLVVLDFDGDGRLGERPLTRLLGLARKHGTAIVCLTAKPDAAPSMGAVVSLRAPVGRVHEAPGRFRCELRALKDKRRPPGWTHTEACRGPAGLR